VDKLVQKINIKTICSGGQIQSISNGFVNFTAAFMALNRLDAQGCQESTALAEAMCDGADELHSHCSTEASRGATLRVYGSTNGAENNSPAAHCGGPNWQAQVYSKYLLEQPEVQFNTTIYTGTVQRLTKKTLYFNK
jgi:hypothetical protein